VPKRDAKPAVRRPTDRSAVDELQRRERETRDNLADFVKSVRAVAAESAGEPRIDGDERALRRRHRKHFSSSVKALIAIVADSPHGHEREYRLHTLWQALGSAAFIANRWTERIEKRVKVERAAHATAKKKWNSTLLDETIIQAAGPIWRSHRTRGAWWVAGEIRAEVEDKWQKPIRRDAIYKRLQRLKPLILDSRLVDYPHTRRGP
jgi:hypothetical protein